jgi:hypothetical protein
LYGITSYGIGCADPKHPGGAYANVYHFKSYIQATLRALLDHQKKLAKIISKCKAVSRAAQSMTLNTREKHKLLKFYFDTRIKSKVKDREYRRKIMRGLSALFNETINLTLTDAFQYRVYFHGCLHAYNTNALPDTGDMITWVRDIFDVKAQEYILQMLPENKNKNL